MKIERHSFEFKKEAVMEFSNDRESKAVFNECQMEVE